jgi:hypothetical protein
MLVVQPVRQGDVGLVPAIVPGLVAADQEERRAPGVESIEGLLPRTCRILR